MKTDDLVCYNAAGMKEKTLGLVVENREAVGVGGKYGTVMIMWCVIGKYMPRKEYTHIFSGRLDEYHAKIKPGDLCVHQIGDWFEVINESR